MKKLLPIAFFFILFLGLLGCTENNYIINDSGASPNSKFIGDCYANKFYAGVDLQAGDIVQISLSGDWNVELAQQNKQMPIGVVYESASADTNVWVCVAGIAHTRFASGAVPSQGWIAYVSSEDGLADNSADIPAIILHNSEIGHVLDYNSTGGMAHVQLHFN